MDIRNVQAVGAELVDRMLGAGFPAETMAHQQVMCLAEEVGEAVQAARRCLGLARTPGSLEALRLELADVVIAAGALAEVTGIDLASAVRERCQAVLNRPVRATMPSAVHVQPGAAVVNGDVYVEPLGSRAQSWRTLSCGCPERVVEEEGHQEGCRWRSSTAGRELDAVVLDPEPNP